MMKTQNTVMKTATLTGFAPSQYWSEAGNKQLEWKNNGPLKDVVPAHGETPRRIDEAGGVSVETTGHGVHDSEFTESVDDVENHDSHEAEVNEEGRGTTVAEGTSGTDEETSTDRATDGDHVKMASLHRLVESNKSAAFRPALEALEVQSIACHEAFLIAPFGIFACHWWPDDGWASLLAVMRETFFVHG